MKLRLAKIPPHLENKELSEEIKTLRQLLAAILAKNGVECNAIHTPRLPHAEEMVMSFSNRGPDPSKFPLEAVWSIFVDRMQKNFAKKSLDGGLEFSDHGIMHSGMQYTTLIDHNNTITVTNRWAAGKKVEMTITIYAQGPLAKAYCQTEIDPLSVN